MKTKKIWLAVTIEPHGMGIVDKLIGSTIELTKEFKKDVREYYKKEMKKFSKEYPTLIKPKLHFVECEMPVGEFYQC